MIFKPVNLLNVFFMKEDEKILLGRLALKDRQIFFEYGIEFLKSGLELSPLKLPLKPGVSTNKDPLLSPRR